MMSSADVNAIVGILVGILVILTTMLGLLLRATVAWVTMRKDIEGIKKTMQEEAIRQAEHHKENGARLDRLEDKVYALRN